MGDTSPWEIRGSEDSDLRRKRQEFLIIAIGAISMVGPHHLAAVTARLRQFAAVSPNIAESDRASVKFRPSPHIYQRPLIDKARP